MAGEPQATIIRVIDIETSGTDPLSAEVCEVGICDLHLEERRILPPQSWLCGVSSMPPQARAIHHIPLSECAGLPAFDQATIFSTPCTVVAAHNSEFETTFFIPPCPVICTYKAALRIWPNAPGHSNSTLRYWIEDQGLIAPDHALTQPAHRAGPDAYTTAHILLALLNAGATGRQMVAWTREPRLLPTCPIGKFRGMPWADVEDGFLGWMMRQATMEEDLRWNAGREIDRRSKAQTSTENLNAS